MDYLYAEHYHALNDQLSQTASAKFGHSLKVRAFENVMLAGYDLCFGLLQFLSHKPKVGLIRAGTSLQEYLLPQFYRLQTPLLFKKENENFVQYVTQFDHEVNFVLWSSENEITGEQILNLDQRQEIHKILAAKRIFSIEIKSRFNEQDANMIKDFAYTVIVESGSMFINEKAFIYHSEKLKTATLIGHYQNDLESCNSETASENINFDLFKKIDDYSLNYFNQFSTRPMTLQDRVVLYSKTVAGSALKAELNLKKDEAFAPSELPSAIIETMQNWWPEAKSTDLIMGLLVIDLKVFGYEAALLTKITEAHDKLSQASTWSIA